jgi:hypothetical protein
MSSGCKDGNSPSGSKNTPPGPGGSSAAWLSYTSKADGYVVEYPGSWHLDRSREGTVSRLNAPGNQAVIDIYAQPLDKASVDDYIQYSNKHIIRQENGVKVLEKRNTEINGRKAFLLMWQRPRLSQRANDLNLYREVDLIFPKTVFTLILKTDPEHISEYSPVLDRLAGSLKASGAASKTARAPVKAGSYDVILKGNNLQVYIPYNRMMFGIFNQLMQPFKDEPGSLEEYRRYEAGLGHKFEFIMTYTEFYHDFPARMAAENYGDGRIMMLTWAPYMQPGTGSVIIPNIANGEYDQYIRKWAQGVKAVGEPVFVRFGNEMNGDWDPWCSWFFSKDADLYIDAWRHVYNLFRQEGASNAIFVWNPHDRSFPDFKWNSAVMYYPGSQYVDWVGLTCYNNGTGYENEVWREFNDMYEPIYNEYLLKYPGKPFLITEFSCSETGGDKAAWIRECMNSLSQYPNIRIAVWYDSTDGKRLYRIDSSPESKEAFRQGLKNPYYLKNGITRVR